MTTLGESENGMRLGAVSTQSENVADVRGARWGGPRAGVDAWARRAPRTRMGFAAVGFAAAVGLCVAGGCSTDKNASRADGGLGMSVLASEIDGEQFTERYDLNGDGEPDVWKVWVLPKDAKPNQRVARILARKDVDLNFDGKVDLRTHFDAQGNIVKEEANLDFDGEFDATDINDGGRLVMRDMVLSADGKPRIRKHFQNGQLVRKERDEDGDGRPEVWEYYEGGVLVRVGRDTDGDGRPDQFQGEGGDSEVPAPDSPPSAP